jgi:hypothetical protein
MEDNGSEGICRASIVKEDISIAEQDGGGVCGFFRMASDTMTAHGQTRPTLQVWRIWGRDFSLEEYDLAFHN